MPTIINGLTGIDLIQDGAVKQADLASNVAGNGPAFSAFLLANQTVTANSSAKIAINTKEFDTGNNFDTALSRYTPTIAGYYQVNFVVNFALSTAATRGMSTIFKNGAEFKRGGDVASSGLTIGGAALVFMNGTTDYLELFAHISATTAVVAGGFNITYFQAFLARSA